MSPLSATRQRIQEESDEPLEQAVYGHLVGRWQEYNDSYFGGRLSQPLILCGSTPPRALGECVRLGDVEHRSQITINRRIVVGISPNVNRPWPALGCVRFVEDILLHEIVHQYTLEIGGETASYRGHGQVFCRHCNRIGGELGLKQVVVKRRGRQQRGWPEGNRWPHNVRPTGYYLGDVDPTEYLPETSAQPRKARDGTTDYARILSYVNKLLTNRDYERLEWLVHQERAIVERQQSVIRLPFRSAFISDGQENASNLSPSNETDCEKI